MRNNEYDIAKSMIDTIHSMNKKRINENTVTEEDKKNIIKTIQENISQPLLEPGLNIYKDYAEMTFKVSDINVTFNSSLEEPNITASLEPLNIKLFNEIIQSFEIFKTLIAEYFKTMPQQS